MKCPSQSTILNSTTFVKFLFTLIKIPLFYQKNEIYGKSCENMV